ncbi:MAG: MCP four helix bundle domain-containing protein [Bacillota bacterium]
MWIDNLIIQLNSKVKWRISEKLTLLIGLLLLSLVITGAAAIYTLNVFNASFQKTLDTDFQHTIIAAQMNDYLMRYDRLVVEYIRSRYQSDREQIKNELAQINKHFNSQLRKMKLLKADTTNNGILSELEPSWNEYSRTVGKILAFAGENNFENAMELWDGWASVRYRDIKYLIKETIDYNLERAQHSKVEANQNVRSTLGWIALIIAFSAIISIILGIIIIRYLQISLRNLILVNEQVSQGNFSGGLDLAINGRPQDELAELAQSNRKVVESFKKMVEDVTALTERYSLPEEAHGPGETGTIHISDLADMEKTLGLVRALTQSLERVKQEVGEVCKSDLVKPGLEEAHHRTLDTIANFNKEIQKLHLILDNLNFLPAKIEQLLDTYGAAPAASGGLKWDELTKRIEGIPSTIINTMEVVKFGLLDQIVLLDSRNNFGNRANSNSYFANLAKAIKNILKQAESIIISAQNLQSSFREALQKANNYNRTEGSELNSGSTGSNEFEVLLSKLEWIMATFNK